MSDLFFNTCMRTHLLRCNIYVAMTNINESWQGLSKVRSVSDSPGITVDTLFNSPAILTYYTDLHYKDRTLSFTLKSRRAHARNRTSDKGGQNERWRNARSAKYDWFSQEYVVLLQLCEKLYTYECIDIVLFCATKVWIYENMPIERCNTKLKKYLI
jgi:hypothetical protein